MTHPPRALQTAPPAHRARYLVGQAAILLLLWLVLSGHLDAFHIGLGVAAVAFVLWINRPVQSAPLEASGEFSREPVRVLRLLTYLPWLFWQMLASGLYVAYLSLHPRCPVAPLLLRFRSHQPNLSAQVVLGNSITLTPGTLTIEIRDGELTVHALTERSADGFLEGSMPRRVARLFGAHPEPPLDQVRKLRSRHELREDHG